MRRRRYAQLLEQQLWVERRNKAVLTVLGVGLGSGIALFLTRYLKTLLFGVKEMTRGCSESWRFSWWRPRCWPAYCRPTRRAADVARLLRAE